MTARLGMRFVCRRCGFPFQIETAPLRPLASADRTLYDRPGMPEALAAAGMATAVGRAKLWVDACGNYRVHMEHDRCGYKGPATDASEMALAAGGGVML